MFLFARARIATDDEGVLLFPRDLHKISILEARPGKNIGESRGPDDESLLLKPALLALTYTDRVTKEKSLFSRLGPISRLRPAFSPRSIPLALSYTLPIHPRIRDHLAFVGDLLDSQPFRFFVLFFLAPQRSYNRSVFFPTFRDSFEITDAIKLYTNSITIPIYV